MWRNIPAAPRCTGKIARFEVSQYRRFMVRNLIPGICILLLVGCAGAGHAPLVMTEYGEFCGQGRPNVGDGPIAEQKARMAAIRPRDTIDELCRRHDLCVMDEGLLSPTCSRAFRDALIATASDGRMTPRCTMLASNFVDFFRVRDTPARFEGTQDPLLRVNAAADVASDVAQQILNTPFMLPRAAFRWMVDWPDRFEPCFTLSRDTASRWPVEPPGATALGRAPIRPASNWSTREVASARITHRPDWAVVPSPDSLMAMTRRMGTQDIRVRISLEQMEGRPSPAQIAGALAAMGRREMSGAPDAKAVLLDMGQAGGTPAIRYIVENPRGAGGRLVVFAIPLSSERGSRLLLVKGEVPEAAGTAGLLAVEELAGGVRAQPR